jgi:hypothetical protein
MFNRWQKAEATVVAKEKRPQLYGHEQEYNYLIDVAPPSGGSFRTKIHYGFRAPDGGFADPAVGDKFGVIYDKHGKVKFDLDDPRIGGANYAEKAEADAFAAAAAAAPGTPAAAAAGPAAMTNVRTVIVGDATSGSGDRLAKLEALHRGGLLDDASYRSAREAVEAAVGS